MTSQPESRTPQQGEVIPADVKRLTPRQVERRSAVLRAVRERLEEQGFDGVSMREVARIAQVSPSTLYEVYGSKETLILAAVEQNLHDFATEEDLYEPGLERFVHRLESLARLFEKSPKAAEALSRLFFVAGKDSPANRVLLDNGIEARRIVLQEMIAMGQLEDDFDVDFYSRALISVTWGTALFWLKGMPPAGGFRTELIRSSLSMILPWTTAGTQERVRDVIAQCSSTRV
jgi:TetR/AcrR family transcriptional regulator, cholesterol catabolism regulator